jgi:hypothetical protein
MRQKFLDAFRVENGFHRFDVAMALAALLR